jgi:putative redox protein
MSQPSEVTVRTSSGLVQEISVGKHSLRADIPASLGGTDTAPGPHELLLAAYGACTSMTVTLYAKRKEWPLQGIEVKLRLMLPAQPGGPERIEREIDLRGPLDEEQRKRLREVADKCPVHKTLTNKPEIVTR